MAGADPSPEGWVELVAGVVVIGIGLLFTPAPVLGFVGVAVVVGALMALARDVSGRADRYAGILVAMGLALLYFSGARWSWIPIVGGMVLLYVGTRGGFGELRHERRFEKGLDEMADAMEAGFKNSK